MDIKEKIENWIKETLKIEKGFELTHPKHIKNGDYSFYHSPSAENDLVKVLSENKISEVEKVEIAGNFINIYLSKDFFGHSIKEILNKKEKFGQNNLLRKQKTIIEYTDPNPFKQFHIGHLMPNVVGESIALITEANGAEVKRANYQGDVGIHVACAIWGIKSKGGIKSDGDIKEKAKFLGECYTLGATTLKENESLKSEIQNINKKLYEKSDKELNEFYKWGRGVSLDYFEEMYKRLGTKFDLYFFESEVGDYGKNIVLEFLKKGIFEKSDGAVVFRGENYDKKLHTRVFVNSDGLPVYEAKELGLAKIKEDKYKYDKSIVITGNEINEYFKVILAAMGEVFPDLAKKTEHISHGMMRLPTGKMSSRTGDVIVAEDLILQVKEKVLDKIKEREFSDKEKDELSEMVAIGAIKYSILRQAIGGDIVFDFDKSISFEGDSGPYLQYACVRANSVLEKAGSLKNVFSKKSSGLLASLGQTFFSKSFLGNPSARPENFEITELEKYLYRFPEVVERAGAEYAPHYIVTYLIELASIFNSFYAKEKIVDEKDPSSPYKIALTSATAYILRSGLHLLGIKVPERM